MRVTIAHAACFGVGVAVAVVLPRLRRRRPLSWGWFTGAAADERAGFKRAKPSTLVLVDGKVPVVSKGPIAWLDGSPHEVFGAGADALTVVPVGGADSLCFAIDATGCTVAANEALEKLGCEGFQFAPPRALLALPSQRRAQQREIVAIVRAASLLAWHRSSAYSGADGKPTSVKPGDVRRRVTASGRSVYPRMDPVAICLVVSADGKRCLLGRQASYPPGMYTCISGFCEHGESAEDAAVREVREETAVRVEGGSARLVGSQPWPCGRGNHCELMLGVIARAAAGGGAELIDVSGGAAAVSGEASNAPPPSGELEAARWFDRRQAGRMLVRSMAPPKPTKPTAGAAEEEDEERLLVPPAFAIAHHLIRGWASGELSP